MTDISNDVENDNANLNNKIVYDFTPISRKGEKTRFSLGYANEYKDNNLDAQIASYKKSLSDSKHKQYSDEELNEDSKNISNRKDKKFNKKKSKENKLIVKTDSLKKKEKDKLDKNSKSEEQILKDIIKLEIKNEDDTFNKEETYSDSLQKAQQDIKIETDNYDEKKPIIKDKNNSSKGKRQKKIIIIRSKKQPNASNVKQLKEDKKEDNIISNETKLDDVDNFNIVKENEVCDEDKIAEIVSFKDEDNEAKQDTIDLTEEVNENINEDEVVNVSNLVEDVNEPFEEPKLKSSETENITEEKILTPIKLPNETKIEQETEKPLRKRRDERIFNFLIVAVALLFILNVALSTIIVYAIKNGGTKNINNIDSHITVNGDGVTSYAVTKAKNSTVAIATGGVVNSEASFYDNSANRGTGVIYRIDNSNKTAYILTCEHVVRGFEKSVYIMFPTYLRPIKVSVVGCSEEYDIAVLKVNNISNIEGISEIESYSSQSLVVGESVFTIGNSLSGGLSASSGIISFINKNVLLENGVNREVQIDATINPGNSGGGLFNNKGEFIGLVSAKITSTNSNNTTVNVEGVSYAIPGTLALGIAESIIRNDGEPSYIDIGVSFKHSDRYVTYTEIDGKYVETFEVRVSSSSYSKLKDEDIVLSFTYIDLDGILREVKMINEYCFEDIKFNILYGSTIEFNVNRLISGEYNKTISVVADNIVIAD